MKWIFVITLVIINPYEGIDYSKVNTYEIETIEYCTDCIGYTESEGWGESEESRNDEVEPSDEKQVECAPPVFIPWRF